MWKTYGNVEVSSTGEIRYIKTKEPVPTYINNDYIILEGGQPVHRLIAQLFCSDSWTPEKNIVDHLDGNKKNNRADNLEWVTQAENTRRAYQLGLNKKSNLTPDNVREIRKLRAEQNIPWKKLGQMFGVSKTCVSDICKGKTWTHV